MHASASNAPEPNSANSRLAKETLFFFFLIFFVFFVSGVSSNNALDSVDASARVGVAPTTASKETSETKKDAKSGSKIDDPWVSTSSSILFFNLCNNELFSTFTPKNKILCAFARAHTHA